MSTPLDTKPAKRSKAEKWPRIREVRHKNGTRAWMVDARKAGKGERYFYPTRGEADTKADQLRTRFKNQGTAGLAISDRLRVEAAELEARLSAVGATLTDAVEYYLAHAKPSGGTKTVDDVVKAFLHAKKLAGRKPEYLRVQGHVLGYFGKTFGAREIHSIGHAEISDWMLSQDWQLRTRENYRRDLGNLFGFAVKHGHCASNPVAKLERITLDDGAPGILSVNQASALLTAAENTEGGALLPYVAIGLFAGLRTSELEALDWSEVSLTERHIEVRAAKAKTRARRIVKISDNLAAWLAPYAKENGPVAPRESLRGSWRRVRKAAGLEAWPKNALRHSFASYHVAFHKNAPQTSLEMGHDNPNQLFQSYRELVKSREAELYWKLEPVTAKNVVGMEQVAA